MSPYEERLSWGVLNWIQEKRRLWEGLDVAFQYLKGAYKKEWHRFFNGTYSYKTKENGFKVQRNRQGDECLSNEGGESPKQADKRDSRCPVPGNIEDQVVWCLNNLV